MTIKETKEFMERIKVYYPNFMVDEYTLKEWYGQLKDYSTQDINEKFNEHLKSEQYGDYIPKINFLTKYLTKEKDKGNTNINGIFTNCQLCGKVIPLKEYKEHYSHCSSVDYIIRQVRRFKSKELTREQLEELGENKFNELYEKVVEMTYQLGTKEEKYYIEKYRESA